MSVCWPCHLFHTPFLKKSFNLLGFVKRCIIVLKNDFSINGIRKLSRSSIYKCTLIEVMVVISPSSLNDMQSSYEWLRKFTCFFPVVICMFHVNGSKQISSLSWPMQILDLSLSFNCPHVILFLLSTLTLFSCEFVSAGFH